MADTMNEDDDTVELFLGHGSKHKTEEMVFPGEINTVLGHWNVCGTNLQFHLAVRPTKWNQFWCAYLIGWKWIDVNTDG